VNLPRECRRLAEVDFPIAAVSVHSAREKSIRHDHPSALHLWWARRPLAACRAVLMGLLLPDPRDPHCPAAFKEAARKALGPVRGTGDGPSDKALRKSLLGFIADFSNWDNAASPTFLETARALVQAAYPDGPPLVVDPFAGGGSIPLEALRVGCETFASDLNPVACLILKVMLEDIPRETQRRGAKGAESWADELRRVGEQTKDLAEKALADLYPKDPDDATPIAYLWARTVKCESPNCGGEIPLARSFWLCVKTSRRRALKHRVVRPKGKPPHVEFDVFEPKPGQEVVGGTMSNGKATCLACGTVLPPERVQAQMAQQHGRADVVFDANGNRVSGARMLAVVTLHKGSRERHYRLPTDRDYDAVWKAHKRLELLVRAWENKGRLGLSPLLDEPINPLRPSPNARGLSAVTRYGARVFGDLFTVRQALAITLLGEVIRKTGLPPLVLGKVIRHCNAFAFWHKGSETVAGAFGRHALPMSWDFPEFCPCSDFAGGLANSLDDLLGSLSHIARVAPHAGQSLLADATQHPLPSDSAAIWFTDPPYYDAIPYSDLSDFFFVWFKRVMSGNPLLQDPYDPGNPLTPKAAEVVQSQKDRDRSGRVKDKTYYEDAMAKAFSEGRRVLREDGIASVVFAHKTTEGWEALLSGIVRGGWTVTGSWPIATERGARLLARDTAALATSVHLVCRPRPEDAPVGDWGEIIRELPQRIQEWMDRLSTEGIRGADLVFSCIGPAMELFSRYSRVETAGDEEVGLARNSVAHSEAARNGFFWHIWQVVGRTALQRVFGSPGGDHTGVLEEDARLTALFLWTLQSTGNGTNGKAETARSQGEESEEETEDEEEEETPRNRKGGFTLRYDVARRFSQPLGIDLDKWKGRTIEIEKGLVRLLPVAERAQQLFGQEGAEAMARRIAAAPENPQLQLFLDDRAAAPTIRGSGRRAVREKRRRKDAGEGATVAEDREVRREATTLDRIHAAMLLQASGQAAGLRALLEAETRRGPGFLRLANALSALYPKDSEEKRLVDAMLLAVPRT